MIRFFLNSDIHQTGNLMFKKSPLFCLCLTLTLVLGACSQNTFRQQTARRIASPAYMFERQVPAGNFMLTSYEKVHNRGGEVNIYIGDDGSPSDTPGIGNIFHSQTPSNPVALHLASRDNARNIIYIARPCQYAGTQVGSDTCDEKYSKEERYSREVVDAYKAALDNLKNRYGFNAFHLIGTGGGAAIAAIIAAERDDIHSLRTVAGVLNTNLVTPRNAEQPLIGSVNPVNFKRALVNMPQFHVIGGQDAEIHPQVLHSYLSALGYTNCASYQMVQEATHEKGWVDKWPELLKHPVQCRGYASDIGDDFVDDGMLIKREELNAPENAPISLVR